MAIRQFILSIVFAFCPLAADESRAIPTISDLREPLDWIGPLRITKIENFHVSAGWSPDAQVAARRISGLPPKEDDQTPEQVTFTLSHIQPLFSRDETERARFGRIYNEGLTRLLDGKDFYAVTAHANYGPPGTLVLISVLSFDSYQKGDVQKEMVSKGYAVVVPRYSSYLFQNFADDYRDELLRLEGHARATKSGVWGDSGKAEQGGVGQPAARSESDSEGGDKLQRGPERRSR
jgi:hypothetical protein